MVIKDRKSEVAATLAFLVGMMLSSELRSDGAETENRPPQRPLRVDPPKISTDTSIKYDYDIVYVRASWPMQRYDWSRTTIWRKCREGKFPAPRFLPGGQRRWLLADLLAWEAEHLGAPAVKP